MPTAKKKATPAEVGQMVVDLLTELESAEAANYKDTEIRKLRAELLSIKQQFDSYMDISERQQKILNVVEEIKESLQYAVNDFDKLLKK